MQQDLQKFVDTRSLSLRTRSASTELDSTFKRSSRKYNRDGKSLNSIEFPFGVSSSKRNSKNSRQELKDEHIEPVIEVSDEFNSMDENISEKRSRVSLFYDHIDKGTIGWLEKSLLRTQKRSRSTDNTLPKIMESKEESYAELKKKIMFTHLTTLVDHSEERLNLGGAGDGRRMSLYNEFTANFRTIEEDPNEDPEPPSRRLCKLFTASYASSKRSSLMGSPRSRRSLKVFIADELSDGKSSDHRLGYSKPFTKIEEEEEEVEEDPNKIHLSRDKISEQNATLMEIIKGDMVCDRDVDILQAFTDPLSHKIADIENIKAIEEKSSSSGSS